MAYELTPRPSRPPAVRLAAAGGSLVLGGLLAGCPGGTTTGQAPTCGPCCHAPESDECQQQMSEADAGEPEPDPEPDQVAPTCGPCCHSPDLPECADGGSGA